MGNIICPKCDSLVVRNFCIKCSYNARKNIKNDTESTTLANTNQIISESALENILSTAVSKNNLIDFNSQETLFSRKFIFSVLFIMLSFVSLLYVYLLLINNPDYTSPVVIANNSDSDVIVDDDNKSVEVEREQISIDFKTTFPESTLSDNGLYSFVPPKNQALLHVSDISTFVADFLSDTKYDNLLKDFDIKSEDVQVFFEKDFVLTYPEEDFTKFGFIIEVKDSKIVSKKLSTYNNEYAPNAAGVAKKASEKLKAGYIYNTVIETTVNDTKRNFILLASTKEYLDEMKESSEGNLKNITLDAKFTSAKTKLSRNAHLFVFFKNKDIMWPKVVTKIYEKYNSEDLLKTLSQIKAPGLLLFTEEGKLQVTTTN